ncbi:MAG TPA: hypothetical protein VK928_00110, partial [Longimicrobiales bacterium]|nr:hypothetical protein [Longimicrobiales bacterium]
MTTVEFSASPLAPVLDALGAMANRDEVELARRFAALFLDEATAEFYMDRTPETVAALVLSAFRELQRSPMDGVEVTVTTPEQEPAPWDAPVTVIRTHAPEAPFIVDSIREYLHARQLPVERFLHPVLQVVRGPGGAIASVGPSSAGAPLESIVHCEVGRIGETAVIDTMRDELCRSLEDVVAVTSDVDAMTAALDAATASLDEVAVRMPAREAEAREVREFLTWLRANFVFLAYRETGAPDPAHAADAPVLASLGLARQPAWSERIDRATEPQHAPPVTDGEDADVAVKRWPPRLLVVMQTDAESSVHRRERMHDIVLRTVDAQDRILRERHFLGLFRARAYQEEAQHIPILRHKLKLILERAGWRADSHNYREAVKIFNSMPKEELFLARSVDLERQIEAILSQYYTRQVRVTLRSDPAERTVSVMVIMPRDRYSGRARRGIQAELIEQLDATLLNTNLVMGGGEQARLHFQLAAPTERIRAVVAQHLEMRVRTLIQTWTDVLETRLARAHPADEARRLAQRWGAALSPEYQAAVEPERALADIEAIESMEATNRTADVRLCNPDTAGAERVTLLTVYTRGTRLVLSDVMPGLENIGLRVLSMSPFEAREESGSTYIY